MCDGGTAGKKPLPCRNTFHTVWVLLSAGWENLPGPDCPEGSGSRSAARAPRGPAPSLTAERNPGAAWVSKQLLEHHHQQRKKSTATHSTSTNGIRTILFWQNKAGECLIFFSKSRRLPY